MIEWHNKTESKSNGSDREYCSRWCVASCSPGQCIRSNALSHINSICSLSVSIHTYVHISICFYIHSSIQIWVDMFTNHHSFWPNKSERDQHVNDIYLGKLSLCWDVWFDRATVEIQTVFFRPSIRLRKRPTCILCIRVYRWCVLSSSRPVVFHIAAMQNRWEYNKNKR